MISEWAQESSGCSNFGERHSTPSSQGTKRFNLFWFLLMKTTKVVSYGKKRLSLAFIKDQVSALPEGVMGKPISMKHVTNLEKHQNILQKAQLAHDYLNTSGKLSIPAWNTHIYVHAHAHTCAHRHTISRTKKRDNKRQWLLYSSSFLHIVYIPREK